MGMDTFHLVLNSPSDSFHLSEVVRMDHFACHRVNVSFMLHSSVVAEARGFEVCAIPHEVIVGTFLVSLLYLCLDSHAFFPSLWWCGW